MKRISSLALSIILLVGCDSPDKRLANAVSQGLPLDVSEALTAGANPNTKLKGVPLVCHAVRTDGTKRSIVNATVIMDDLLEHGADPDSQCSDAPLIVEAASWGQEQIIYSLVKTGVNPNSKSSTGESSLFVAACNGHSGVVGALVALGATRSKKAYECAVSRNHDDVKRIFDNEPIGLGPIGGP